MTPAIAPAIPSTKSTSFRPDAGAGALCTLHDDGALGVPPSPPLLAPPLLAPPLLAPPLLAPPLLVPPVLLDELTPPLLVVPDGAVAPSSPKNLPA